VGLEKESVPAWAALSGGRPRESLRRELALVGLIKEMRIEVLGRPTTRTRPKFASPRNSGLVGYAAIKYTAIVIIVLAILAFLAWYIIPRIG
jgi:hypothetical protein